MSDNQSGLAGLFTPDMSANLMNFGAGTLAAAGDRTSQGFLRYPGLTALGAGVQNAAQMGQQRTLNNAQAAERQAQAAYLGEQTGVTALQRQMQQFQLNLMQHPEQMGAYARAIEGSVSGTPSAPMPSMPGSVQPGALEGAIAPLEGNNPNAINAGGYLGRDQVGAAALASAGVYTPGQGENLASNQWRGTFHVPGMGDMGLAQVRGNPQAQSALFSAHAANLAKMIQDKGLLDYSGQTITAQTGKVPINPITLLAGAHFAGPDGLERFVRSGGRVDPTDSNKTRLSGYMMQAWNNYQDQQSEQQTGQPIQFTPDGTQGQQQQQQPPRVGAAQPQNASDLWQLAQQRYAMGKAFGLIPGWKDRADQYQKEGDQYMDAYRSQIAPQVGRPGGMFKNRLTGQNEYIPSMIQGVTPHGQNTPLYSTPEGITAPGGASIAATNGPGGTGVVTKMSPAEDKDLAERMDTHLEFRKKNLQSLNSGLLQLDLSEDAAKNLNNAAWSSTGEYGRFKLGVVKALNGLIQSGGGEPIAPDKVGAFEELQKLTTTQGMQFVNSLFGGQREAASIIQSAIGAVPNVENTPQGFFMVLNAIKENMRYQKDKYYFEEAWSKAHQGDLRGSDSAFEIARSPTMYAQRAVSQTNPIQLQQRADADKYLPGTKLFFTGPDGQPKYVTAKGQEDIR